MIAVTTQALALTLLHSLWQGALVAVALAVARRALRRASPEARYLVACAALLAILVAPLLTFASVHRSLVFAAQASLAAPFRLSATAAPPSPLREAATFVVCGVWATGATLMLLRIAIGQRAVRRLVDGSAPAGAECDAALGRLAAKLGVLREVRVRVAGAISVPAVAGWVSPVVLLPIAALTGLPMPSIEAILAHELAHVRRHDYLVNALQSVALALLFYHPAAFWVARVVRAEREHACDDLAVAALADPVAYARALASAEALRSTIPSLEIAFTGGSLVSRIRRLLQAPPAPRRAPLALALAAVIVALGACSAVVAGDGAADRAKLPDRVTRWMPEVEAASVRHGVDPDLLAVLVTVESGGDPQAVSPAGALGLMQIMPATGESIAAARGLAGYSTDRLRDPAYNLDLGAFYLAEQLRTFTVQDPEQKVALAAAAYNAGPDAVRAYLAGTQPLPDETTRYQTKVLALWKERAGR
jgi:D-alanyl-D-alanine endopeptidase (penicillin-binding protein 7)